MIAGNRWSALRALPDENPFDLLEERPANYGGAYRSNGEVGVWYYDAPEKSVVYRPRRINGFRAADGRPEVRFRLQGLGADGAPRRTDGVAAVVLRPEGEYRWLGRLLR